MGKFIYCLMCSGLLLAILVSHLYVTVPPSALEPSKQRWFSFVATLVWDYVDIVTFIGLYKSDIAAMRSLPKPKPQENKPEDTIQATNEIFSGVAVRMYRPTNSTDILPGLIYLHGGGWCLSSIDDYDEFVRKLARESKVAVISVEYRLAPEFPYPIPMEDCYAATLHFLTHSRKYGVDPKRIGIIGDDTGGNLAAAVALKMLDQQGHNIQDSLKLLMLFYPPLQALDFTLPSYVTYSKRRSNPGTLDAETMVDLWKRYAFGYMENILSAELIVNRHFTDELKQTKASHLNRSLLPSWISDSVSHPTFARTVNGSLSKEVARIFSEEYFAPLMASNDNLHKLPSTYILTCEYDPLRDDGFLFYERMENLKHDVEHKHWSGMAHGFLIVDYYESAEKAMNEVVRFIQDKL